MAFQTIRTSNNHIASILIFIFFSFSLVVEKAYHLGALLLPVIALLFIWLPSDRKIDFRMPVFFIFIGIVWSFHVYIDLFKLNDSDRYIRIILAGITLIYLLKLKISSQVVFYGIALGAFGAFCVAVYQKTILGLPRAQGDFHPIIFGNLSLMLGLMSLSAALVLHKKTKLTFYVLMLGAFCGVFASLLSGSRGGWLVLPVILGFIFFHTRIFHEISKLKIVASALLILTILAVSLPSTGVYKRVQSAEKDIYEYVYKNNRESSLGARFEMWKSALIIFWENPIKGAGKSRIKSYEEKLVEDGDVNKVVKRHAHAHSDYFDSLSERGAIGFAVLLLFYIGCFIAFRKKLALSNNPKTKALALMGTVAALCYMGFSLSESLLTKNMGISFFCFTVVFIWAALDRDYQQQVDTSNVTSSIFQYRNEPEVRSPKPVF